MTISLAMIGAGRIAGSYAEILADCDRVEMVGVADQDPLAAKQLAEQLDCDAFDDHMSLIDAKSPDAAIVCTPPATHPGIAIDLLGYQVSVMCEKPLAIDPGQARRMLSAAASSRGILTMASKFRYVEDVPAARDIALSGEIGEVILVENTFASRVDMEDRWNSDPEIAGGGVLIDNGTHSVDIVRYILGPITEVMALEGKRVQGLQVEDTAQVFLKNAQGTRATIDLSWSLNKERPWYLEIYGSNGTIQVGWAESRYRVGESGEWTTFGSGYDRRQAMRDQVANFAASILGDETLRIGPEDAIASVDVIEAAYRSLDDDRWIHLGDQARS